MLPKDSILYATRKSIVDHCCTFMVAMVILWVLTLYRHVYPLNYLMLFIWILALTACIPPACLIILSNQQSTEIIAEEIFPISIDDLKREKLIEILKYCWPNCSSVRDRLLGHKTVLSRAAILTLSLSMSLFFLELNFSLSTWDVTSYIAIFRSAISCWWTYTLLSGLRFGGFAVSESQHRSAKALNAIQQISRKSCMQLLSIPLLTIIPVS
jgi:hypothetical protein